MIINISKVFLKLVLALSFILSLSCSQKNDNKDQGALNVVKDQVGQVSQQSEQKIPGYNGDIKMVKLEIDNSSVPEGFNLSSYNKGTIRVLISNCESLVMAGKGSYEFEVGDDLAVAMPSQDQGCIVTLLSWPLDRDTMTNCDVNTNTDVHCVLKGDPAYPTRTVFRSLDSNLECVVDNQSTLGRVNFHSLIKFVVISCSNEDVQVDFIEARKEAALSQATVNVYNLGDWKISGLKMIPGQLAGHSDSPLENNHDGSQDNHAIDLRNNKRNGQALSFDLNCKDGFRSIDGGCGDFGLEDVDVYYSYFLEEKNGQIDVERIHEQLKYINGCEYAEGSLNCCLPNKKGYVREVHRNVLGKERGKIQDARMTVGVCNEEFPIGEETCFYVILKYKSGAKSKGGSSTNHSKSDYLVLDKTCVSNDGSTAGLDSPMIPVEYEIEKNVKRISEGHESHELPSGGPGGLSN